MAKVTIYLTRGQVEVQQMPDQDVLPLLDEFRYGPDAGKVLTISLDGGGATHIAREHIVRIDVDEEAGRAAAGD